MANCTFEDAETPFLATTASIIYSDNSTMEVEVQNSQFVAPTPLQDIPEPSAGEPPRFLSRNDQWFVELRNVRP